MTHVTRTLRPTAPALGSFPPGQGLTRRFHVLADDLVTAAEHEADPDERAELEGRLVALRGR